MKYSSPQKQLEFGVIPYEFDSSRIISSMILIAIFDNFYQFLICRVFLIREVVNGHYSSFGFNRTRLTLVQIRKKRGNKLLVQF